MDMPSAYWHVPMEESSIPKTAFEVPGGKFEMLRMPFGLKNSQSTQQRLMDQVLGKVPKTDTYIDNILTHSTTVRRPLNKCVKATSVFALTSANSPDHA